MRKLSFLLVLLLLCTAQVFAQRTITGKVTNAEDGAPIPGVTVQVKGTSLVALTDLDGKYSITGVAKSATTLQFSYVGMKPMEVALNAANSYDVSLETTAKEIEGVVVTALGISREKKSLGYSVQSVKTEELTRANNSDVVNSLQGRSAGVQVVSSGGTAGASAYITIRGSHSLTGNNQPLFVVDGVPIITGGGGGGVGGVATSGRSIELNPDDIASMSVLKGGAATALYGLQAANGAIIITTKKGSSKSRMQVNLAQSFTLDKVSQLPARQNLFTQGMNGVWSSGHAASWGQRVDTSRYDNSNITTPGSYIWDVNGKIVGMNNPKATTNPVKVYDPYSFFQTGLTSNTSLAVSGGNDLSTYYFSIANLKQKGIVPNNTFGRTSFKLNAETKLTSKIKTGSSMNYINSRGNFIQQGSNTSGVMLGLLRTPPTFNNSAGYIFPDGVQRNYRNGTGYDNPYWTANMNSYKDDINRFIGNVYVTYDPLKWLTFNYKLGTDWFSEKVNDRMAVNSRAYPAGYDYEYFGISQIINSDFFINLHHTIVDKVNLNLTLGQNLYSSYGKSLGATANGLSIPEFYQLSNTGNVTASNSVSNYRTAAVFGDLSLDYASMIYLGMTGRNEWATTMPNGKPAFYPSFNIGFVFTELPGLKGNDILSFGKLRASWAKTANIAGAYNTLDYYYKASTGDGWTNGITYPFLNNTGYTVGDQIGNSTLKHETQISQEVGLELHFLKDRITLDVSLFKNLNKDLLLGVPVAASSGFGSMYMNAATMESKGFEIVFGAIPVKTTDFEWDINANFSRVRNPVTKLADGVSNLFLGGFTDPQIRAVAGMEYRTIFGYDYYRDDKGNPIIYDGSDPNFDWPVGFPIYDGREMRPLGSVNPDWIANFTNTFTFKGITLSALVDIKHGGKLYNGTRFAMNYFGTSEETANREVTYNKDGSIDKTKTPAANLYIFDGVMGHIDADGNPVISGSKNTTQVVRDLDWYRYYGGSNFAQGPTAAVTEDAGWVRLREVTLSYRLPSNLLKGVMLKGAEISFTGKNLWLHTKYSGIDPETSLLGANNAQGMDYFNMPGTKSYTFGLKVDF